MHCLKGLPKRDTEKTRQVHLTTAHACTKSSPPLCTARCCWVLTAVWEMDVPVPWIARRAAVDQITELPNPDNTHVGRGKDRPCVGKAWFLEVSSSRLAGFKLR